MARGERGQSLVEMALGFTVLIVLVSGLLDLGRAYFTFVALEDGAGEAALYLAINPTCRTDADGTGECANPNNADYRARHSGGALVDWTDTTRARIFIDPVGGATYPYELGDTIEVRIEYDFELLMPFIIEIAGGSSTLTLTAHATQNIIGSE